MSEGKDANIGKIRKRYQPLRERAEKLLVESGIQKNAPEFRKARQKFTREAYMAGIDEVTKLPIRSLFETRLEEELNRSEREKKPLTLIFIDLNNLKRINLEGLPAGDKALRTVADKILKSIRKTDYAARYGGDEFAVLLLSATDKDITGVWERLDKAMEGQPYTVTASAMQINKSNINEARIKLTQTLKITKESNNHEINAFKMTA